MDSAILGIQVVIAAVFLVAGLAKLRDLRGARKNLEGFGIPPRAAAVLGPLLAMSELGVAIALVPISTARWGAIGALVLLGTFAVGIVSAMLRGQAPDCGCFGKLYSAPAGGTTLSRNLALAALAALIAWRGPDISVGDWVTARTAAELVAVAAVAGALGFLALSLLLMSKNRALRRALADTPGAAPAKPKPPAGLPVGVPAPSFELSGIRGEQRSLESLLAKGKPVVLMFFDPTCSPCKPLVPKLALWQASLGDRVTIAVVADGSREMTEAVWDRYAPGSRTEVLVEHEQEVTKAYNINAWPAAVAVGADGRIASEPAFWHDTIEVLVRTTLNTAVAPAANDAAPVLKLTVRGGSP